MKILAFDPSGNWGKEGMGTTGVAMLRDTIQYVDEVAAKNYRDEVEYWDAVLKHIHVVMPSVVVVEGFKLYGNKKNEQVNSELQTPQLIGVMKYECFRRNIPCAIQFASEVKTRWADDVLIHKEIITYKNNRHYWQNQMLNNHKKDAIRHAIHFQRYGRLGE